MQGAALIPATRCLVLRERANHLSESLTPALRRNARVRKRGCRPGEVGTLSPRTLPGLTTTRGRWLANGVVLAAEAEIKIGDHVRVQGGADGVVVRIHTFSSGVTLYFVRTDWMLSLGEWMRREDLELFP